MESTITIYGVQRLNSYYANNVRGASSLKRSVFHSAASRGVTSLRPADGYPKLIKSAFHSVSLPVFVCLLL
jgi:hypothetical protein